MGFRNCLEAGWIGFEPLQDLEYVDLYIIAQMLEQSIKCPLPQLHIYGETCMILLSEGRSMTFISALVSWDLMWNTSKIWKVSVQSVGVLILLTIRKRMVDI